MSEEHKVQEELNIPFSKKTGDEKPVSIPPKKNRRFHIPAPAWFGIGCAVVIGGLLAGMKIRDSMIGEEIALLDSSVPVFTGYSGGGSVGEYFAPEDKALSLLRAEVEKRQEKGRETDSLERLIASISCGFEKEGGYANQENITYACTYDTEAAEQAGIRFTSGMKTYTVSGLDEYAVLDVFDGFSAGWQLDDNGLSIRLDAPQEYLDMGISYSYDYGAEEYNGETIDIHAQFDQNVLRSYGYVVASDEITWTLGPMPEQISDVEELSDEERSLLIQQMQAILEDELSGCGNRAALSTFGRTYSIEITGIQEAYIDESALHHFHDSHTFRISFALDTNSESLISALGSFSASYTGRIYRMGDGAIRFMSNTVHACEFSGLLGSYSLREE